MKLIRFVTIIALFFGPAIQTVPHVMEGKTRFKDATIKGDLKKADDEINAILDEDEKDTYIQKECRDFINHSIYWGDTFPYHNALNRSQGQRALFRCLDGIDKRYNLKAEKLTALGQDKIEKGTKLAETNKLEGEALIAKGSAEINEANNIKRKIKALERKVCPNFESREENIPCDVYDPGQTI